MQTYISLMELAPTATLAHFHKLPYTRLINFVGTIGEGENTYLEAIASRILVAFPYKFDFPFVTVDRFMQNLVSKVPIMVVEGNHEIEEQVENQTFVAYRSRFAFPSDESRSSSTFYYSFNAGGIHFIMLGAYVSYNKTGLEGSIAAVILNLL